ncbi:hypothetical protein [Marinimicrobium agarilyticum]|uniref:hypothetical protein n=1 Tax=Marinimicrobium agarilyticum TaxID=306546 RepID=UPI0004802C8B|nr:hypothetical protein [Marinimicrobium agarilyticum]
MVEDTPPQGLNALLYFLNYVTDLSTEPVLPDHLMQQIESAYKPEMVRMMCEALKWSVEHPEFDFEEQIPLSYKNEEIYLYLEKVDRLFESKGICCKFFRQKDG